MENIRIESDGTPDGTKIYGPDGTELEGVISVEIHVESYEPEVIATLEVADPVFDVEAFVADLGIKDPEVE